jgi:hypothetical protein
MPRKSLTTFIPDKTILNKICLIRNQKVMLASDLAFLYGVDTKVFNQSVKRNLKRFPEDFMFQLTQEEFDNLRSQFVTSSWGGALSANGIYRTGCCYAVQYPEYRAGHRSEYPDHPAF